MCNKVLNGILSYVDVNEADNKCPGHYEEGDLVKIPGEYFIGMRHLNWP